MDAPEVVALLDRAHEEMRALYPPESGGMSVQPPLPSQFVPPAGVFLMARVDGRPAGCGGLRRIEDGVAEIKRMYVGEEFRRAGVARAILTELESAALSLSYRVIRLETGILQPQAISLYERAGYGRIPSYGEWTDRPLSVCFEKVLTTPR